MAGRFPSPVPPYPPLVMADSERDRLEFLAHRLIHKALEDYDVHRQNGAKVDARSWKLVRKSDQLAMYKRAEPSSLYQSPEAATAIRSRAESASIIESSITQGRPRQKMPILLQVGAIQGTLNEVMYGTIAVDGRGMMLKTAYTDDTLLDGETLCQLRGPSATHPFRFLGVKWVVKATNRWVRLEREMAGSKQIEDVNEVDDFGEITIHESSLVKVVDPRDQRSCSYPTPNPAAPGRESAQEEFMARIIAMRNAAEDAYRTTRKTAQAQFEQLSKAHNGFSHGQDSFSVR
ncbi:hypothetical protein PC111_g10528 [Phytophthora cactorum]|nr:hypothetical protein PC111_g10528 [Phytophthora cactorum]